MLFNSMMKHTVRLVAIALILSGCGFEPMLATPDRNSSPVSGDLAKIRIAYIDNRSGQILRNTLIDTLTPRGEPARPDYTLTLRIVEPLQNLAYQRNNSVTNVNYNVSASGGLYDKDGTLLFAVSSSSSSVYSVSSSQYATLVSLQSARDRAMSDLSVDIRNKLSQYFVSRGANTATSSRN